MMRLLSRSSLLCLTSCGILLAAASSFAQQTLPQNPWEGSEHPPVLAPPSVAAEPPAKPHAPVPSNPLPYDLLLVGGHVIDGKNHIDGLRDVAIKDGKIADVGVHLDPKKALKVVDVKGLYVTPGLIDIHVHVYAGTGEKGSYAGDNSVYPDGFTFRTGVTTVVDAGSSGWRDFDDFKARVIDRSKTRVLAELNIVGSGMRGTLVENNLDDMNGELTGAKAKEYPGLVVGIKSAHFAGPEWKPYDQAEIASKIAGGIPVMIDYGTNRPERPLYNLVAEHLKPGDIYTHCYSGLRGEQNPETGGPSDALLLMRKRGIYCDVGHGGGSFAWSVATPIVRSGYKPDSISTDLHIDSMNAAMKDMLNVAGKMMAIGESVHDVIVQMTVNPAHEIHHDELGNLTAGSIADVAVLSLHEGQFGFEDMYNTKMIGTKRLQCELTIKDGKVVYDYEGITADPWNASKHTSDPRLASHWTTFGERLYPAQTGQKYPPSTPAGSFPAVDPKNP
ncbi:amidohydrolase/deacetylase family metallohydrolase [Silvibacterium sp.]|uniref:amidohydrolase/deacetylase family metallohydrolase n=1 Tax=Silvibacterium sp. TaxID=1964179 RepID=UPI0039E2EB58